MQVFIHVLWRALDNVRFYLSYCWLFKGLAEIVRACVVVIVNRCHRTTDSYPYFCQCLYNMFMFCLVGCEAPLLRQGWTCFAAPYKWSLLLFFFFLLLLLSLSLLADEHVFVKISEAYPLCRADLKTETLILWTEVGEKQPGRVVCEYPVKLESSYWTRA